MTNLFAEQAGSFEKTINNDIDILNKKIAKITMIIDRANVIRANKNKEEILTKYQDIRTEFIDDLDDLMLRMLDKLLIKSSTEYRAWEANVKAVVRKENQLRNVAA